MIYGIGIDIVEVERIKKKIASNEKKLLEMLFTEKESSFCQRSNQLSIQAQCFAARFAVKEAFFKAIGSGLRNGLNWKDVVTVNDKLGKPSIVLQNKSLKLIEEKKITNIQLSISHTKTHAVAVVILEKSTNS